MSGGEQGVQPRKKVGADLKQFHRLVELQKQMIHVAKQNERTKRECATLQKHLDSELIARLRGRPALRHHFRHKAKKALIRLPAFALEKTGITFMAGCVMIADAAQKVVKAVKLD
jgi:hypothetical protein